MSKEMKAVIVSGNFILIAAIIGIFQYTLNSQSTPPANPPISENWLFIKLESRATN